MIDLLSNIYSFLVLTPFALLIIVILLSPIASAVQGFRNRDWIQVVLSIWLSLVFFGVIIKITYRMING